VPARTRGLLRETHTQQKPHSSIQVWPNTRPSLRDGRTAYAVISREPNFPSGLPHPANWRCRPPGWARAHLREAWPWQRRSGPHGFAVRSSSASPRGFAGLRRRSSTRGLGLTGTTRPALASRARRCRVHRNPARVSNDSRTAPFRGPGCVDLCRNSEFR